MHLEQISRCNTHHNTCNNHVFTEKHLKTENASWHRHCIGATRSWTSIYIITVNVNTIVAWIFTMTIAIFFCSTGFDRIIECIKVNTFFSSNCITLNSCWQLHTSDSYALINCHLLQFHTRWQLYTQQWSEFDICWQFYTQN